MDGNEQTNVPNRHGHDLVMEVMGENPILVAYGCGVVVVRCKLCNRVVEALATKTAVLEWFNAQTCRQKLPAWAYDYSRDYTP